MRPVRIDEPHIPDEVTGQELDRQVRGELGTLSKDNATQVARHLVMTFSLLEDDPEAALRHAMAAQRRAGRVGLVREAAGLAAYHAGEYEQALRELRTARRLTGSQEHLAVMADCERGLGRPDRALALATSPEARSLDRFTQLELLIVAAGARQDLGQHDAAVVVLQVPELQAPPGPPTARLLSAYADALEAAGRHDEARTWLHRAAVADTEGLTGAAERAGLLTGDEHITDLLEDDDVDPAPSQPGAQGTGVPSGASVGGPAGASGDRAIREPGDRGPDEADGYAQTPQVPVDVPVPGGEETSEPATASEASTDERSPATTLGVRELLFSDAPGSTVAEPTDDAPDPDQPGGDQAGADHDAGGSAGPTGE